LPHAWNDCQTGRSTGPSARGHWHGPRFATLAGAVLALAVAFGPAGGAQAGGKLQDADLAVTKGRAAYNAGQYREAVKLLAAGVDANPDNADGHLVLGWAFMRLQRYDDALPELKKALELDPTRQEINFDIGYTLIKLERGPEAIGPLTLANKFKATAEGYYYLGVAQYTSGDCPAADGSFKDAVRLDGAYAQGGLFYSGLCQRKEGKVDSSNKLLQQAIDLDNSTNLAKTAQRIMETRPTDADADRPWFLQAAIGMAYDSNVTLEPTAVSSGGAVQSVVAQRLSETYQGTFNRKDDFKAMFTLVGGGKFFEKSGHSMFGSLGGYMTVQATDQLRRDFNFSYYDAQLGYQFRNENWTVAIPVRASVSFLGTGFTLFSNVQRLEPFVSYVWNEWTMTTFRLSAGYDIYNDRDGQIPGFANRTGFVLSSSLIEYWMMGTPRAIVGTGYTFDVLLPSKKSDVLGDENAAAVTNDWQNHAHTGNLVFVFKPHDTVQIRLAGNFGGRFFTNDLINPLAQTDIDSLGLPVVGATVSRKDTPIDATLSVRYDIFQKPGTLYVNLSATILRNFSTVELYDITRWQAGLGFGGGW
jgi:tetratricopeptide (TPR) repeat protein